ncbi:TIGR04222 domain-containing membrane protein [Streptomyces sp. NPDC012769]|uniref:TIGR04222 domain-containing membrane protein n=1 Tax=Streptomyces sp. NPDC012769 TaxID=3364848 RepID=UPI0036909D5E
MNTLVFFYYVLGGAGMALLFVKRGRTGRGPGGPVQDRYEAAFLNGGPARVVDTALAALHGDGRVVVGGPGIVQVIRPTAHDPVERAVFQELSAAPHGALAPLRYAVMRHPAVQEIGDGLAGRGLIMEPRVRRSALSWSTALGILALISLPFSLILTVADLMESGPRLPFIVKVLPVLVGVMVAAVLCATAAKRRVTPAGQAAVTAFAQAHAHLTLQGMPVALYGLRALPDPFLREQLATAARTPLPSPVRRPSSRPHSSHSSHPSHDAVVLPVLWCAASAGGTGGGCGGGSSCSGGGSSCSGGGSSCSGGGSTCSSGSSGSSSSCSSSSSSSSCSSSSGSSCSSSSS